MRPVAATVLAIVLVAVAACGTDRQAQPRQDGPTTTTAPPTTVSPTTVSPTTRPTSTTRLGVGQDPIPSDPEELDSCDELPSNAIRTTPARWWVEPPDGWDVSYAFSESSSSPHGEDAGASTLVRLEAGDIVAATVTVRSVAGDGVAGDGPSTSPVDETTVRGVPAVLGPEVTRGGPTGATQASWSESERDFTALGHGVDEAELRSFLEASELADGVVTEVPTGWQLLGSGRDTRSFDHTSIGFTPRGGDLNETGIAPVELVVADTAGIPSGSGAPEIIDPTRGDVTLTSVEGRPALSGGWEGWDGGGQQVRTTTVDGQPVSAQGPLPVDELRRMAGAVRRVDPRDPLLVGVAIGRVNGAGGACRDDR